MLQQADRNRNRMKECNPDERHAVLADLQAAAADRAKCHAFLLRSAMIEGLRRTPWT